jgi:glyoxylate reductase
MPTPPVVVTTRQVVGQMDVPGATVRMGRENPIYSRDELLAHLRGDGLPPDQRGADAIVSMYHDRIDAAALDAAASGGRTVRGVVNFAVGFDNIDRAECARRGVLVCNTPDAVTEGTANLAWALILACTRRLIEADRYARSPDYPRNGYLPMKGFLGVHLTGQTLLIVGAGRIGRAVALRALGFGMRVLYTARTRHADFEHAPLAARRVDLEEGLRLADVVSLHTPLTPATRHLINRDRLSLMKPTAVLVNTARGPVIDEAALVDALRDRRLYAAGLDVYEHEPRVSEGLVNSPHAVLTPHIGSAERYFREQMTAMVSANCRALLTGERPPNLLEG